MQCRLWTFLCLGPRHHQCYAWRSLGPSRCSNFTLSLVHFPTDELAVLLAARWDWVWNKLSLKQSKLGILHQNLGFCIKTWDFASKLGILLETPRFHFRFDLTNTTGTPRSFGFLSWCRCVDTLDCFRQIIWNISVPNQSSCLGFKSHFLGEVKHHLDLMDLNPNSWDFGNPESKWS